MKPALTAILMLALSGPVTGTEALPENFETLRAKFASSPFGRPLLLESFEEGGKIRGDVFALVWYSLGQIRIGLNTPAEWCEVLILHLNVKTCAAGPAATGSSLQLSLGTKRSGRDDGVHHMDFRLSVPASSADRFEVTMQAEGGPLGTRDYHLSLEATPIAPGQSLLHFRYSYIASNTARLAMSTYLHTVGKDKVGFTVTGHAADGAPLYVGGARGAVERNAMRYFLGIETFLASTSKPPASRREWQLTAWFDATEKYGRQLHEVTRAEYLSDKEFRPEGSVSDSADTL